ncbi:hypothetical protein PRIPAC_87687 [Pristionchus pacificus]|uniref:Uncharacterized protein n=1 Tax=Pristionchus pacificus TaxID=54126 RepID=A0A2A6CWZ1_PRIPA|nr:hypothetical protein PRIPAC_87687 [Pristionchus pacificus]|eukprot:PDM82679.1 hypothetical protein PRIPAC_37072 [Pristionchus pacificus]
MPLPDVKDINLISLPSDIIRNIVIVGLESIHRMRLSLLVTLFLVPILDHVCVVIAFGATSSIYFTLSSLAIYAAMIYIIVRRPRSIIFKILHVIMGRENDNSGFSELNYLLYYDGIWTLNGRSLIVTLFLVPILGHLVAMIAMPTFIFHNLPTLVAYVAMIYIVVWGPRTILFKCLYVIMMLLGLIMIGLSLFVLAVCSLTPNAMFRRMFNHLTDLKIREDDLEFRFEGKQRRFPFFEIVRLVSMIIATFTISRTYVVLVAFNAVRKETVKYESQSLPFVHTLVTRPNDREEVLEMRNVKNEEMLTVYFELK